MADTGTVSADGSPDDGGNPGPARQVAALCTRKARKGHEVLLITSRDTGRWIIPKGWPIKGKSDAEAALQEAWEEAGVKKGKLDPSPLGHFRYDKILEGGTAQPVKVTVFHVRVGAMSDSFPEAGERKLKWTSPDKAADLVEERDLAALLRRL